jgi:uncharacterized protein (TIGR00369 family)
VDPGPFANSLGLTLTSASGEEVVGDWQVTEVMLQHAGLLHGGVHCAMVETLDSVGASLWLGDRGRIVGVANSTDFLRASRPGDRLTSTAVPIHRGRSQQVWRVETRDVDRQLVAVGQVRLQNLTG